MIIIGIDPGNYITGYGIIETQDHIKYRLIDCGCIRLPRSKKFSERYLIIYKSLQSLLEKYSPDALAVETQFVNKNVQSAMKLGMVRGIVLLAATLHSIPSYEYAPTKVKLAVVGRGRAHKQQVQSMVKLLLNLKEVPEPDDIADALALAICHSQASRHKWQTKSEV